MATSLRRARAARGLVAAITVCSALAVSSCSAGASGASQAGAGTQASSGGATEVPSRAEPIALSLPRPDGTAVDLASLRGSAVLIVAIGLDDLNSQIQMRHAERVARAHPDDLHVLALSGDRRPFREHALLAQTYEQVLELQRARVVLATDEVRDGHSPLGVISRVPTTLLLNRAGALVRRIEGPQDEAALEALVRPALPPGR